MTQRVVVGRLTGVFGIRGELKCLPTVGAAAIEAGRSYSVSSKEATHLLRCRSVRRHHEKLVVAFDGFDSPEAARALSNSEVAGERDDVELEPGEFLDRDLVGLRLVDELGADIGRTVVGVVHYPAQDCLIVDPGQALVPMVNAFIRDVDLVARTISTTLPEGLFD